MNMALYCFNWVLGGCRERCLGITEYKESELIHSFVKNEVLEISRHDIVNSMLYPKVKDMTNGNLPTKMQYYTMIFHENGSLTYVSNHRNNNETYSPYLVWSKKPHGYHTPSWDH